MFTTPITQPLPRNHCSPSRRKTNRRLTTLVVFCPMVLFAIHVSRSETVAQDPPATCWACGVVQCEEDPESTDYRGCTKALAGGRNCGPLPVPDCPPANSCTLRNGLCPEVMALAAPERNRAIRTFERGGMLPADGAFYVAMRGDQIVLREKCGTEELARMAARDVGKTRGRVVVASAG